MSSASDFVPIIPEIFIAVMAMLLLLAGAFRKENSVRFLTRISMVVLLVAIGLSAQMLGSGEHIILHDLFIQDNFSIFIKMLILSASIFVLLMSLYFTTPDGARLFFEFPVLVLLATLGMMIMVSANDLMTLYLGLELQSLSLYILAAMMRENLRSSEAGLKYFILGALTSGIVLYGCSLIYGFTGSTNFTAIAQFYAYGSDVHSLGVLVGLILVIIGLCFKLSAAPFHMWTPDVYEGAPTITTAFFAAAPKIAALALFIRFVMQPFGDWVQEWQQLIIFISVLSMLVGGIGALRQVNIKRLMAYSAIGHAGYILVGLATGTAEGIHASLVYAAIYVTMSLGVFACILLMRRRKKYVEDISDLAGLAVSRPLMALTLSVLMLSMAGIPPMAGFFGKFFVFYAAIEAEMYSFAVIGVLTSVIAAFYYLRIIKVMYFDCAEEALDRETGRGMKITLVLAGFFNACFFLFPAPLLDIARTATSALF